MSAMEVYQLDYDEEILSHLGIPESVNYFWAENLRSELILDDFTKDVWEWQKEHLRLHKKPATASVLAEEFELELEEPLTAVGDLMDRLRERYMKNAARSEMTKLTAVYKEDPAAVPDAMLRIGRDLATKLGNRGQAYGTGDHDRAMARYDQLVLAGPGASFGFKELNAHFYGMRGVTAFVGAPKSMKSWITVHVAVDNVLEHGNNVWLYSLELPPDETDMRIRCHAAGVPYWRYLRHSLNAEHRDKLSEAAERLDGSGIYRVVKPPMGHRTMPELIERARDGGADLVLIDQLQYVEAANGKMLGECDTQEYWGPMQQAREYSDDGPIGIVHQFNRTVQGATEMPEPQQIKASAAVEETCTLAMGLWANKEMRKSNMFQFGALVSRNYDLKTWEIEADLTRDCKFDLIGEVLDDE